MQSKPLHNQVREHTSHSCHKPGGCFAASQTFPELLAKQMRVFSSLSTFSSQSRPGSAATAGQDCSDCFPTPVNGLCYCHTVNERPSSHSDPNE